MAEPKPIEINVPGVKEPLIFPHDTSQEEIATAVQSFKQQQGLPATEAEAGQGVHEQTPALMATAGGVAGAYTGAPAGPFGAAGGAALGATGGYYAGKVIQDQARGVPQTWNRVVDNSWEAVKNGVMSGVFEGLPSALKPVIEPMKQAAGKAIGWIGRKTLLPKTALPETAATQALIKARGGPGLTVGQMHDPEAEGLGSTLENVAYNSFFSRVVKDTRGANKASVQAAAHDVADAARQMPEEQASKTFQWAVDDNFERLVYNPATEIYKGIRDAAPGRIVEATPVLQLLRSQNSTLGNAVQASLRKIRELPNAKVPRAEVDQLISLLDTPKGAGVTQALPKLTFDQTLRLKSALSAIANKPAVDQAGQTSAANAGSLAAQLDQRVRDSFVHAPDLLREYDSVTQLYADGHKQYKNELVQSFMDSIAKKPGGFSSLLLKPDQSEAIASIKQSVGPLWDKTLQPMLAGSLVGRANNSGVYNGKQLTDMLLEKGSVGPVTGKALFGDRGYQGLLDLGKALEQTSSVPQGKFGMAIALRQASYIGAIPAIAGAALSEGDIGERLTSGAGAGLLTITIAPWAFGRLVANPSLLKMYTEGIVQSSKQGKVSKALSTAMKQIMAQGTSAQINDLTKEPTAPRSALPQSTPTRTLQPEAR